MNVKKRERDIIYTNRNSGEDIKKIVYSLMPAPGLHPVTVFMPPMYRIAEVDGKRVITDKNGTVTADDFAQRRTLFSSVPCFDVLRPDGKTAPVYCDILDSETQMKITAYYTHGLTEGRWNLEPREDSVPVQLYLPSFCKLIRHTTQRSRTYIRVRGIDEPVHWLKGSTITEPPCIEIGTSSHRRKICYFAEDTDIFHAPAPRPPVKTQLPDGRWQIDELIINPEDKTSHILRSIRNRPYK